MKIKIQCQTDRENFIIALANNGYKSYVQVEEDSIGDETYYVVFEERSYQ